jgi:integral membrane protein (TIGR00529 family)
MRPLTGITWDRFVFGLNFMELLKLLFVFVLMIAAFKISRQLSIALILASIAVVFVFRLEPAASLYLALRSLVSKLTITTVFAFYAITFLQRMLEKREKLIRAQEALNGIFNNRRINASLAPMMIGMLPAAGVVTIAGAIVEQSAGDSLDAEEKTFVASYYRHVPESFLPTFPGVIIGAELAGVALSSFLLGMIPVVMAIISLGFIFYLRKVPKHTGNPPSENKAKEILVFFKSLWTLFVIVALVIIFKSPVYLTVLGTVLVNIIIDRFSWAELKPLFISAFEKKLLLSTVCIMIFKDLLISANVISALPEMFSRLPLPSFIIYTLIIFFGSVISGQQAINVMVLPMAFAAGSGEGVPLFILLMTAGYCAMQISPTHICLPIIADYFKVPLGSLVKKTLPVIIILLVLVSWYYLLLKQFM